MSAHLPVDLYSPDQLGMTILELRQYVGQLRDSGIRAKATDQAIALPPSSPFLASMLSGSGVAPDNQDGLDSLLHDLETIRDKAPVVHLMLTALPNRALKRQFTVWFRSQIHPYALLNFTVRTDLGGGIVVRAGSRVYNFSFREQILAHKNRISEIFAGV